MLMGRYQPYADGRYDAVLSLAVNYNLTDKILSRDITGIRDCSLIKDESWNNNINRKEF